MSAAGGVIGVVNADHKLVLSGCGPGEGIAVGRAQRAVVPDELSVKVNAGLAGSLKEKREVLRRHFGSDADGASEPREALEFVQVGQAAVFSLGVEFSQSCVRSGIRQAYPVGVFFGQRVLLVFVKEDLPLSA